MEIFPSTKIPAEEVYNTMFLFGIGIEDDKRPKAMTTS
jgi:hypothetical protein